MIMSNWTREQILERAVRELHEGDFVYVGPGLLQQVLPLLPEGMELWLHSPDGVPGGTMYPTDDYMDARLIDAGKDLVQSMPPLPYSSTQSFAVVTSETADVLLLQEGSESVQHQLAGMPSAKRALVVSWNEPNAEAMAARYSQTSAALPLQTLLIACTGNAFGLTGRAPHQLA